MPRRRRSQTPLVRPVPVRQVRIHPLEYVGFGTLFILNVFIARPIVVNTPKGIIAAIQGAAACDIAVSIFTVPLTVIAYVDYSSSGRMKIMQQEAQEYLKKRREWLLQFRIWSIQLSDILDKLQWLPSVCSYIHVGFKYISWFNLFLLALAIVYALVTETEMLSHFWNMFQLLTYRSTCVQGEYSAEKVFGHFAYSLMLVGAGLSYYEYVVLSFIFVHAGYLSFMLIAGQYLLTKEINIRTGVVRR